MTQNKFPWLDYYSTGVSANLEYPEIPLAQVLENTTEKYPDKVALVFQGINITYSSLLNMVLRLATGLASLGVKKGDRVAIMLPNCPQWVISYYAALKLGATVVQTNPMYVERELALQLNNCAAETIIALNALYPRIENVLGSSNLKNVICVAFPGEVGNPKAISFESLLKENPPNPPEVVINPKEDIAVLQYTGGTTGVAKGVMLTHANLLSNVVQTSNWLPLVEGEERFLVVLPLFHVYSMTLNNNLAVFVGGTQYLMPKFEIDTLMKVIDSFKPTMFPGAPTLYIAIINHPKVQEYNLKSIKACISGSAPLPVEVAERFNQLTGGMVVEGYGLSEASPVTHVNPFSDNVRVGTIGLPIPDTEAKVVDIETGTRELAPGEVGELIVRGPQVMKGYWNMPEDTANTLKEGWLYTGDIAKMDQDGYFSIVDRKKDTIIAGGFNIYPREIEEVLYAHPQVLETAVIGVPDPYRGETVKAFIVLRPGQQVSKEEITAYCREKLASFKVPQYVDFCESLPKTTVGKILRKALKEMEKNSKQIG
ncbi:MAG TPA: long-chain fatty acid--CoA ligase [Candidatus Deferrimicrobium sp.]|nr:long-chain fatty acid--CoA ligase [Candidatus Deferrimicrobium sp.]